MIFDYNAQQVTHTFNFPQNSNEFLHFYKADSRGSYFDALVIMGDF